MKKIILLFLFCLSVFYLYSEEIKINQDVLINGKWSNNFEAADEQHIELWGGILIIFNKNYTCSIIAGPGQGGKKVFTGKYDITNNKLNIYSGDIILLKNGILKYDIGNLKFSYFFEFENNINQAINDLLKLGFTPSFNKNLFDLNTKVKEGLSVKINGIDCITIGNKNAVATDNLNIREKPSINAKRVEYQTVDGVKHGSLPQGTYFTVLARTINKDNVNAWNNYWYYIEYSQPDITIQCWVFAEFVRLK